MGPDMLAKSDGKSARNPEKIDDRMVLMAASDGGGMANIVKCRKNLQQATTGTSLSVAATLLLTFVSSWLLQ